MRMRELIESRIPMTEYGYWITPAGEVHPVPFQGHEKFVEDAGMDNDTALREGWIRIIATTQGRKVFVIEFALGAPTRPARRCLAQVVRQWPDQDSYEVEIFNSTDEDMAPGIAAWKSFREVPAFNAYIQQAFAQPLSEAPLMEFSAIPETEYGYWLSPSGEFIVVPFQAHGRVMKELGVCKTSGWKEAFMDGWVRIGSNIKQAPNMLFVEFGRGKLSARTLSALRRLSKSQEFRKFYLTIMDYDGGPIVDKDFEQMGPFLLAVQEAGRAAVITEASVPYSDYGYWIDDLGTVYPVSHNAHLKFLQQHGDPLVDGYDDAFNEGWIRVVTQSYDVGTMMVQCRGGMFNTRGLASLKKIATGEHFATFYVDIIPNHDLDIPYAETMFNNSNDLLVFLQKRKQPISSSADPLQTQP